MAKNRKTSRNPERDIALPAPPPLTPPFEPRPEVDAEIPNLDDGLTLKQRLFVDAIVGPARGNATKAAEMAGYNAENNAILRATAYENLTKPHIQQAIANALAKKKATAEWAEISLVEVAEANMSNFLTLDATGEMRLDLAKGAASGALGQIREYVEEAIKLPGDDTSTVLKRRIKLHDRAAGLRTLLQLYGKLIDRMEASGPNGGPIPVSDGRDVLRLVLASPALLRAATTLADALWGSDASKQDAAHGDGSELGSGAL